MAATKIMMIRHGEKQEDFPGDPNIDRQGRPDPASLNGQGWRRAQALIGFFHDPEALGVVTPSTIFAAAPSADSQRPMQTVTPLAEALWPDMAVRRTHFDFTHDVKDLDGLLADVMKADGAVLICWEHKRIPALAAKLNPIPAAPTRWPGHRFDVVWVFDLHGKQWVFSQSPENLLPGDKNKPIRNEDD